MTEQQSNADEALAAVQQAAERQRAYEDLARQTTWAEAHRRLADAAKKKAHLQAVEKFIAEQRPNVNRLRAEANAAVAALEEADSHLITAEADATVTRDEHNHLLGVGQAMRQMILDQCAALGIDPPADPLPVTASPQTPPLLEPGAGLDRRVAGPGSGS